ncbi:outer membrane beta-barrel protein [Terasakiella pusilla]|uniref:outer membrane beta-barrel protein n=1 Tax=Terasakiella pusilla TaxID=64973 RepID=UPI003AA83B7E
MSLKQNLLSVTCLGFALIVGNGEAFAQEQPANEAKVNDKKAQEYNPKGVNLGAFTLFPKVVVEEKYNSNIYKEQSGKESDWITDIEPSLSLRSGWSRHMLRLDAKSNIGRYADNNDDNYEDYELRARGRLDASNALSFSGDLQYANGHEERGGDDVGANAAAPVETNTVFTELGMKFKPNRWGLELKGEYDLYDVDDNRTLNGAISNNDDRDRKDAKATVRVGYEFQKGYEAYVKAVLNDRDYDDRVDDNNFNRDSDGYNAQAGLAVDLSKLLRADFGLGYMEQDYADGALQDVSGWSGDVRLSYFVTPLSAIRATVVRSIDETTDSGSSAAVGTRYGIGVDHDLLRNLRLSGDVAFAQSDYEGSQREDDKLTISAQVDYKLNRNFFAGAMVEYEERDSNQNINDYDRNIYMIKLGAQF